MCLKNGCLFNSNKSLRPQHNLSLGFFCNNCQAIIELKICHLHDTHTIVHSDLASSENLLVYTSPSSLTLLSTSSLVTFSFLLLNGHCRYGCIRVSVVTRHCSPLLVTSRTGCIPVPTSQLRNCIFHG